MANRLTFILIIILALTVSGVFLISQNNQFLSKTKSNDPTPEKQQAVNNNLKTATLYKSPYCGCCVLYAQYLESNGFKVEIKTTENIEKIKEKYKIPKNLYSCHTTIIDNYFIEGHIPIKAINKILKEKPEIEGIALPKMPSGSPGMNGVKKEPFKIYQLKNGEYKLYLTL